MIRRFAINDTQVIGGILLLIILTIFHSYLLFHVGVEFFSILISFSIFIFGWNTKKHFQNSYLLVIAVAYLFVAFFDMVHTLTYQEMGIFEVDPNFAIETWIAGRFLESFTFLAAYRLMDKKVEPNLLLFAYFLIALALFGSIAGGIFPDCYVAGEGLTPFKKGSEYVISLILFASGVLLYRNKEMPRKIKQLVIASITVTIFSELSFTLYTDMFGIFNIVGHILKILSFYLLYKAILEVGLTDPMALMSFKLQESEEANRKKQELLIQQSRLVGAGEALSNIAHQWRQPLSALGVMIQDMQDAYRYGELDERYMNQTVEEAMKTLDTLSATINRFSTFFASSKRVVEFDLRQSIETVLAMLAAQIEDKKIRVEVHASCACSIRGVENDFSQAVFHILNNAIDVLNQHQVQEKKVTITITKGMGGKSLITIADNGGGFDPAVREKIFEPYTTTKHKAVGVGLGLYIAKTIIEENLGGRLEAEEDENGAVFRIEI